MTGQTFQARNDVSSIMVDCTISWPGKTPHVTALTASFRVFVLKSPYIYVIRTSFQSGLRKERTFLFAAYMLICCPSTRPDNRSSNRPTTSSRTKNSTKDF